MARTPVAWKKTLCCGGLGTVTRAPTAHARILKKDPSFLLYRMGGSALEILDTFFGMGFLIFLQKNPCLFLGQHGLRAGGGESLHHRGSLKFTQGGEVRTRFPWSIQHVKPYTSLSLSLYIYMHIHVHEDVKITCIQHIHLSIMTRTFNSGFWLRR